SLDVSRRRLRTDHQTVRDLLLGQTLGEQVEDLVLSLCQGLQLSVRACGLSIRGLPIHKAYDSRDQLTWIDGLDQIVVRPDQNAAGAMERFGAVPGDKNNRERVAVAVAKRAADLVPIQAGKLNVKQDRSGKLVGHRRQDLGAARERPRGIADPLE